MVEACGLCQGLGVALDPRVNDLIPCPNECPEKDGLQACWNSYQAVHKVVENTPTVIIDRPNSYSRQLHAAMGMSGESGEILELYKKDMFGYHYEGKKSLDEEKLLKEIGDIFWYFSLMLYASGFSLDEVMRSNAEKLRKRYAEKFLETEQPKAIEDKPVTLADYIEHKKESAQ